MTHPNPEFDPISARSQMVEKQLRARGIRDRRVLAAMLDTPREHFVPPDLAGSAYDDCALPVGRGQTISQPYMVALMTERLKLAATHRVLEIGTGSGYQAAILARLCTHVFTVERITSHSDAARRRLAALNIDNVSFHVGDGSLGWPQHAPFDRVIVTAAAPEIPAPLVDQLALEGILVVPVGGEDGQTLVVVERRENRVVEDRLVACRFVKLVGAAGWPSM